MYSMDYALVVRLEPETREAVFRRAAEIAQTGATPFLRSLAVRMVSLSSFHYAEATAVCEELCQTLDLFAVQEVLRPFLLYSALLL